MNTDQIAYKVVNPDYTSWIAKGKYQLVYMPDSIISAPVNTLGVFLFHSIEGVNEYTRSINTHAYKILKVITLSKVYYISDLKIASSFTEGSIDHFYNTRHSWTNYAPSGTICCHKIRVLKEVTLP